MKIKKVLAMVIAFELLAYPSLYAEEQIPQDKPGTAVFVMKSDQEKMIEVTGNIIKQETKGLQVDMKIPIIHDLNNKFFQKRINYQIKKQQLCLKKGIEKDAFRDHQYAKIKGFPVIPYTLMTNYNVKANDEIFSLETTIYDYRGGAHGLTTNTYYNIDTKKSKLLKMKDFFKPSSDYKTVLNQEINKQIKERQSQGEVFFDDEWGFKGIKEDQSFYMNEKGNLVIVFGLYEIAPYSSGIIEFLIPEKVIHSIKAYD